MALLPCVLPANLDYTNYDFDSLRQRLISLIKSVFPDWDDFETAAFGNLLLEMYAFVGDVLGFYQDAQARESRLSTATQRKNVIILARMLGYRMRGATAARTHVVFSLDKPAVADVPIPAGTVVRTKEVTTPVRFQLLNAATIPAGATSVDVLAEHSESSPGSQFFDATGAAWQELQLDRGPYLDGSLVIGTPQGAWQEVESFLGSSATDKHFTVTVDQNDLATVTFGDGNTGMLPSTPIEVTYKTGGGTEGNVEPNTLTVLEGNLGDIHGTIVKLNVTNPLGVTLKGQDRETIAHAKEQAPRQLRALSRCVAREDFETAALTVPGVARALMLSSDELSSVAENTGNLYVVPDDLGTPSEDLKTAVRVAYTTTYPKLLGFRVNLLPPRYRTIDVQTVVWCRSGYSFPTVAATIKANLKTLFALTNADGSSNTAVDFGYNVRDQDGNVVSEVAWSDVFNCIRDSDGVRKAESLGTLLNTLMSDVELEPYEFPKLGVISVRDGHTGAVL